MMLRGHDYLRNILTAIMMVAGAPSAFAQVLISVDKNSQQMSVSVNGVPRYRFTVSTGRPGYVTPSGTYYHPQRMERSWFSQEYAKVVGDRITEARPIAGTFSRKKPSVASANRAQVA
jgi:hypothetical protein